MFGDNERLPFGLNFVHEGVAFSFERPGGNRFHIRSYAMVALHIKAFLHYKLIGLHKNPSISTSAVFGEGGPRLPGIP